MEKIVGLIIKSFRGTLSPDEQREFDQWAGLSEENKNFVAQYTDENIREKVDRMASVDWEAGWERFKKQHLPAPVPVVSMNTKRGRWIAAAAVLILLMSGLYFVFFNKQHNNVVHTSNTSNHPDILPGTYKAALKVDDQQDLLLDTTSDLTLSTRTHGAVRADDALVYQQQDQAGRSKIITWNTVSTPRGGYYRVVLPDGTRAWINAESSIRFPSSFEGSQRKIQITGEVFMDVAKNASNPFIVETNGINIEVLGTQFNVNAYEDENAIVTTLLEGSVKVITPAGIRTLIPGQQLGVLPPPMAGDGNSLQLRNVNVEAVTAWKNGNFQFEGSDINSIMRQVARWYNVNVVYEGKVDHAFVGHISRNEPISRLLQLLEMTGEVHFRIEGRTIHVQP